MRTHLSGLIVLALLSLFINTSVVRGEDKPMTPAERLTVFLPKETLGFIATSGGDYLKEPFEQSSIGKAWAEPSVQEFYQKMKEEISGKFQEEVNKNKEKEEFSTVWNFVKTTLKRPTLICVAQQPEGKAGCDSIYGFMLVEGGERKAEIEEANAKLAAMDSEDEERSVVTIGGVKVNKAVSKDEPVVLWGWVGNYFVLSLNDEKGEIFSRLAKAGETKSEAAGLWNKLPATNDLVIKYADFEKIGKLVSTMKGDKEGVATVKGVLDTLGLSSVRAATARAGFAGRDMVSDGLIEIAEPRTGIFSHLKPADMSELDKVPAGVISAFVTRMDFAGIYDTLMEAVKTASMKEYIQAVEKIGKVETELGIEIRKDLLANLEGTVYGYSTMGMGFGLMPAQTVYILRLKDAKVMEAALAKLESYAEKHKGDFEVTRQEIDGRVYHFMMIPQIAMMGLTPTWVVENDQMILGTNMQAVNAAVALSSSTQPTQAVTLRQTDDFKQATKNMPRDVVGFLFVDHKQNVRLTMQTLGQMWPMMTMGLQQQTKMNLPMTLPPAENLARHMGPEAMYWWFDRDGLRVHDEGSLNSSTAQATIVAGATVGILPAFDRAREAAQRAGSASNMKQICMGLLMYANDNQGKFPEDLNVLVEKKYIPEGLLKSPIAPSDFKGPSYIYVQGLEADCDPRLIVLYENPAYQSEGTNVGYCDGHVMFEKPENFIKALRTTYETLGKPMPTVEFTKKKNWFKCDFDFDTEPDAEDTPASQPTTQPLPSETLNKKIPFKCTDKECGMIVLFSIGELQKVQEPGRNGPMMGPMVLDCSKCKKHTLTQAVECPACDEIFILTMDPKAGIFDDTCPKCGKSYAKVWQEKYPKRSEKE